MGNLPSSSGGSSAADRSHDLSLISSLQSGHSLISTGHLLQLASELNKRHRAKQSLSPSSQSLTDLDEAIEALRILLTRASSEDGAGGGSGASSSSSGPSPSPPPPRPTALTSGDAFNVHAERYYRLLYPSSHNDGGVPSSSSSSSSSSSPSAAAAQPQAAAQSPAALRGGFGAEDNGYGMTLAQLVAQCDAAPPDEEGPERDEDEDEGVDGEGGEGGGVDDEVVKIPKDHKSEFEGDTTYTRTSGTVTNKSFALLESCVSRKLVSLQRLDRLGDLLSSSSSSTGFSSSSQRSSSRLQSFPSTPVSFPTPPRPTPFGADPSSASASSLAAGVAPPPKSSGGVSSRSRPLLPTAGEPYPSSALTRFALLSKLHESLRRERARYKSKAGAKEGGDAAGGGGAVQQQADGIGGDGGAAGPSATKALSQHDSDFVVDLYRFSAASSPSSSSFAVVPRGLGSKTSLTPEQKHLASVELLIASSIRMNVCTLSYLRKFPSPPSSSSDDGEFSSLSEMGSTLFVEVASSIINLLAQSPHLALTSLSAIGTSTVDTLQALCKDIIADSDKRPDSPLSQLERKMSLSLLFAVGLSKGRVSELIYVVRSLLTSQSKKALQPQSSTSGGEPFPPAPPSLLSSHAAPSSGLDDASVAPFFERLDAHKITFSLPLPAASYKMAGEALEGCVQVIGTGFTASFDAKSSSSAAGGEVEPPTIAVPSSPSADGSIGVGASLSSSFRVPTFAPNPSSPPPSTILFSPLHLTSRVAEGHPTPVMPAAAISTDGVLIYAYSGNKLVSFGSGLHGTLAGVGSGLGNSDVWSEVGGQLWKNAVDRSPRSFELFSPLNAYAKNDGLLICRGLYMFRVMNPEGACAYSFEVLTPPSPTKAEGSAEAEQADTPPAFTPEQLAALVTATFAYGEEIEITEGRIYYPESEDGRCIGATKYFRCRAGLVPVGNVEEFGEAVPQPESNGDDEEGDEVNSDNSEDSSRDASDDDDDTAYSEDDDDEESVESYATTDDEDENASGLVDDSGGGGGGSSSNSSSRAPNADAVMDKKNIFLFSRFSGVNSPLSSIEGIFRRSTLSHFSATSSASSASAVKKFMCLTSSDCLANGQYAIIDPSSLRVITADYFPWHENYELQQRLSGLETPSAPEKALSVGTVVSNYASAVKGAVCVCCYPNSTERSLVGARILMNDSAAPVTLAAAAASDHADQSSAKKAPPTRLIPNREGVDLSTLSKLSVVNGKMRRCTMSTGTVEYTTEIVIDLGSVRKISLVGASFEFPKNFGGACVELEISTIPTSSDGRAREGYSMFASARGPSSAALSDAEECPPAIFGDFSTLLAKSTVISSHEGTGSSTIRMPTPTPDAGSSSRPPSSAAGDFFSCTCKIGDGCPSPLPHTVKAQFIRYKISASGFRDTEPGNIEEHLKDVNLVELFAYGRLDIKSKFPACTGAASDGHNLFVLDCEPASSSSAASLSSSLSSKPQLVVRTVEAELSNQNKFQFKVSRRIILQSSSLHIDTLLRGYSMYTNGHVLTIGVLKEALVSSKEKDKSVTVNYHSFDLITGDEKINRDVDFPMSPSRETMGYTGFPSSLTFDNRNNFIWGVDPTSCRILRWRSDGLQPRSTHRVASDDLASLLSSACPQNRLRALSNFQGVTASAAKIMCHIDRLSEPYSPPLLTMAEEETSAEVEVFSSVEEEMCSFRIKGVSYSMAGKGWNFVVVNYNSASDEGPPQAQFIDQAYGCDSLADFLEKLPFNSLVLVATSIPVMPGDAMPTRCLRAFESIGVRVDRLRASDSFAAIGVKGASASLAKQSIVSKHSGAAFIRQNLPTPFLPLSIEASSRTFDELMTLLLKYERALTADEHLDPSEFSLLLSTIRIITTNIYQLIRGTSTAEATHLFKNEHSKMLKSILLACTVKPPKHEVLALSCLQLFKGSLNLFWPTSEERCELLIGYLQKYKADTLQGFEPQILQLLLIQLSKASIVTELLSHGASVVGSPNSLVDNLLAVVVKEWCAECKSLVDRKDNFDHSAEKAGLARAAMNMLATLNNHYLSMAAEMIVLSGNGAATIDVAPVAAPGTVSPDTQGFAMLTGMCSKFVATATILFQEALALNERRRASVSPLSAGGESERTYLDSDIEQLLSVPLVSLLPNLIFTINLVVECRGAASISQLPALSKQFVPLVELVYTLMSSLPKSALECSSSITETTEVRTVVLESKHPYLPYTDELFELTIPGATSMTIVFDSRTKTETSYDYVQFWKDKRKTEQIGGQKFSGRNEGDIHWPGHPGSKIPPLVVNADTVYVEFKSDGSNEDWGWLLTASATVKSKSENSEVHWVSSLESYVSACVSSICSKLVMGIPWSEGDEDACAKWFEDSMLGGDSAPAESLKGLADEAAFLEELVTRPVGSLAADLVKKMKRWAPEDQGTDSSINDAVYASCAALLWGRSAVADAVRFAKGEDKMPSSELTKAWKLGQKMRQFFSFSDVRAATEPPLKAVTATSADEMPSSPPGLIRGDSLYSGADEKVVNHASLRVVERVRYLLAQPRPTGDIDHEAVKSKFKQAALLALTRQTSFGNADRWKKITSELQSQHKLSRLMEWRKVASERRSKNRVPSISERILTFLQSSVSIDTLAKFREKRNERADLRTLGLTLFQELMNKASTLQSKAWAVSTLQAIHNTRRESSVQPKAHFLNAVEGSSAEKREHLRTNFFGAVNLILAELSHIDEAHHHDNTYVAEDSEEARAEEVARTQLTIACLKAISIDYDYADHEDLQKSNFLRVLRPLLSSKHNNIRQLAWFAFELLLARGVGFEGQPVEVMEHPTAWTHSLLALLEEQLENAVDSVLASHSSSATSDSAPDLYGDQNRQSSVITDAISVDKISPGKLAGHQPLGTNCTIAMWIKRRPTEFDAVYRDGTIRVGWRVRRSDDHEKIANLEKGESQRNSSSKRRSAAFWKTSLGTVTKVMSNEVEVKWDSGEIETCRFGKINNSRAELSSSSSSQQPSNSNSNPNVDGSISDPTASMTTPDDELASSQDQQEIPDGDENDPNFGVGSSGEEEDEDGVGSEDDDGEDDDDEDEDISDEDDDNQEEKVGFSGSSSEVETDDKPEDHSDNTDEDEDDENADAALENQSANFGVGNTEKRGGGESESQVAGSRKVYDVVVVDEEASGLIFWKGVDSLASEEMKKQAWSVLKLQVNPDCTVGFSATQTNDKDPWLTANGMTRVKYDEWTHVAIVLSPSKCKLYVNGVLDAEKALLSGVADAKKTAGDFIVESPHPYLDNSDTSWKVAIEGAKRYRVAFDPRTKTEKTFDFVRFWGDASQRRAFGEDKYCGGLDDEEGNWPGLNGNAPLIIEAEDFVVQFKSDGSNNSWGFRLIATPIFDDDRKLAVDSSAAVEEDNDDSAAWQPLPNLFPFHFGNPPQGTFADAEENPPEVPGTEVRDSFDGFIGKMSVFGRRLRPEEIKALVSATKPIVSPMVPESNLCLDVLCMVLRCARSGVMLTCATLVSPSVIKALLTLSNFGEIDVKIAATRVLQFVMPLAKTEVVDAQARSLGLISAGLQSDGVSSYVEKLMLDIGCVSCCFYDAPGSLKSTIGVSRRMRVALCTEEVKLLRALAANSDFAKQLFDLLDHSAANFLQVANHLNVLLEKEVRLGTTLRTCDVDARNLHLISASLEILGGSFGEAVVGASGTCRLNEKDGGVEECTVIADASPPSKEALEKMSREDRLLWSDGSGFGDALIVTLASDPSRPVKVPFTSVSVLESPLPSCLDEVFEGGMRERIISFFRSVLDCTITVSRPELLPIVKERDAEIEFESDHPHPNRHDGYKTIVFKGTDKMEVSFVGDTRTVGDNAYVRFYKDETHTTFYGDDKYFGNVRDGNWPGLSGRPPLKIPSNSCVIYFHSDTSDVDYGFKVVAKAHTVETTYPPVIPPPIAESCIMMWRASCAKALHSLVVNNSFGIAATCGALSMSLVRESLREAPPTMCKPPSPKPLLFESAHPYPNSLDTTEEIYVRGAKSLSIVFDSQSRTEPGCDYVVFFKDSSKTENWGETKYTGGKDNTSSNWPGIQGRPPLVIPANRFFLHFHSDGSVNDWGYKFTVTPQAGSDVDLSSLSLFQIKGTLEWSRGMIGNGPGMQVYPDAEVISRFPLKIKDAAAGLSGSRNAPAEKPSYLPDAAVERMALGVANSCSPDSGLRPQSELFRTRFDIGATQLMSTAARNGNSVLVTVPGNTLLSLIEEQGDWLKVKVTGNEGAAEAIAAEGWVLRRLGDEEYLIPQEGQQDASSEAGASAAGSKLISLDMSELNGLLDGWSEDPKNGKEKHPALAVADSSKEGVLASDESFGFAPTSVIRGQTAALWTLTTSLAHLASINYSQRTLTAMIPHMSLSSQFRAADVRDLIAFLQIIFAQQQGSANGEFLLMIQCKIVELIGEGFGSDGGSAEETVTTAKALCEFSLNQIETKMVLDEMVPPFKAVIREIETAHNYPDNEEKYWRITIPGAKKLKLVFDDRCATETDCDYIKIYQGGNRNNTLAGPYSGRQGSNNFPGANKNSPKVLNGNDIEVYFRSDSSNNDWGVKLKIFGIMSIPSLEDLAEFEKQKKKLGCQKDSVNFALWLLELLSLHAGKCKAIQDCLFEPSSLKMLRKFAATAKADIKIIEIAAAVFESYIQMQSSECRGVVPSANLKLEIDALADLVFAECESRFISESASASKSQRLQALVEASVMAMTGNLGTTSASKAEESKDPNILLASLISSYSGRRNKQWLNIVRDCSQLMRSFETRELPLPLVEKEVVPKLESKSTTHVRESFHPTDNQEYRESFTCEGADLLEISFDPQTCLGDKDVVYVEGGGVERVLVGLEGETWSLGSVDCDSITVGDKVVRGKDWKWNDQDGGSGNFGQVIGVEAWKGKAGAGIRVQWATKDKFGRAVLPSAVFAPVFIRPNCGTKNRISGINPCGKPLVVSEFSERDYAVGYTCNSCEKRSSRGHCGGSRRRWWCPDCQYDLCFECSPLPLPSSEPKNSEGCTVSVGSDGVTLYCGRMLGEDAIPGSDGRCGPTNGPQCCSCKSGPVESQKSSDDKFAGLYRWDFEGAFDLKIVGVTEKSKRAVAVPGSEVTVRVVPGGGGSEEKDGTGRYKGCRKFSSGGHLSIPYSAKLDLIEDFTFSIWVRPDPHLGVLEDSYTILERFMDLGDLPLVQISVLLLLSSSQEGEDEVSTFHLQLSMQNAAMETAVVATTEDVVKSGKWNHLCVLMRGDNCFLFVNGERLATAAFVGDRLGNPTETGITVGASQSGGSCNSVFHGYLYGLRIWGRALDATVVRKIALSGAVDDASAGEALCCYDMDEAASDDKAVEGGPSSLVGGRYVGNVAFIDAASDEVSPIVRLNYVQKWGWKFVVKPHFIADKLLARSEVGGIKHELEKLYMVGAMAHDVALVAYANSIASKKNFDILQLLRTSWEDIAPMSEDLVRSPILRDLAHLNIRESSTKSAAEGGGASSSTAASSNGNSKLPFDANLRPIGARWKLLQMLNQSLHASLPYIDLSSINRPWGLASLVSRHRRLIFSPLKSSLWSTALAETRSTSGSFRLYLSRSKALKHVRQGDVDVDGRWTCFGQAFRQLHSVPPSALRHEGQLYSTIFVGERAQDAGGPYRESYTEYANDVQSVALGLFVQAPNGRGAIGMNRDAWLPSPGACSPVQMEMMAFLGKLFGIAIRSKDYLNLTVPSIIWKAICGEEVDVSDLEAIDLSFMKSIDQIRNIHLERLPDGSLISEKTFEDVIMETFSTLSTDDRRVELLPGGFEQPVTFSSRHSFCDLCVSYRLSEFRQACSAIRRGLGTIVPLKPLSLFTWSELNEMVCGKPTVDVALLRSATEYSNCLASDPHILLFWAALNDFTNDERIAFVRFTWGRSRLPLARHLFPQRFKLQSFNHSPADSYYPVAHTCFFSLELPAYSTLDIMKERLRYAIFNCTAIDGDDTDLAVQAGSMGWEE